MFEEELKSNIKDREFTVELITRRSKNATSSFNVAPREVKKQQQRKQFVLLKTPIPLDDEDDEEYYFEEQHHHHKQKRRKNKINTMKTRRNRKSTSVRRS